MVDSFHALITRQGAALIAAAATEGADFRFAALVAGSRDAAPDEVWRGPITGVTPGADAGMAVIDATIPLDEGGFTIRQIGVLDADDNLILYASAPEAYKPTRAAGAIRDLAYRLVVRFANAETVNLLIDPHIVTATRKWTESFVAEAIATHDADPAAHAAHRVPNATTERRGVAELATAGETAAGTDPERVVTPFGLRAALPPVLRPVNRTPADGAVAVGETPTLTGSVYHGLYGLPRAEALHDRSGEIVNLFRVAQRHPEALLAALRWALASREAFEHAWVPPPATLTDIERAARFFHIPKHNHGGKPDGRSFPARPLTPKGIDPGRPRQRLDAWHARPTRVTVKNLPHEEFIARHDRPETRFHLDPPDWGREDYYGRALFGRDDFARLESLLAGLRDRFILSRNAAPERRRLFARFAIAAVETTYFAGSGSNARKAGEVLISGP